jgi:hypothetical protein
MDKMINDMRIGNDVLVLNQVPRHEDVSTA